MRARVTSLIPVAVLAIVLVQPPLSPFVAQAQSATALAGQVTSSEEGPMEGVLVSARKADSTLTTTVVSDQQGRYRFPRDQARTGRVFPPHPGGRLRPRKRRDRVGSSRAQDDDGRSEAAEGGRSRVATDECGVARRAFRAPTNRRRPCAAARTATRSNGWPDHGTMSRNSCRVVERMSGYPPLAFPLMPQRTPAPRIGPARSRPSNSKWRGGVRRNT